MVDDFREDQILIPYPMTKLRFWRNTHIATTPPGQSGSLVKNYLGYEWDESPDNGFRLRGLIRLSLTTVSVNTYILDYGHTEGPGIATHSLTLYRDPVKGAIVFGAGTVMWAWGLDPDHDPDPRDPTPTPTDPNVKQAMVNLLADMGVFAQITPAGLGAGHRIDRYDSAGLDHFVAVERSESPAEFDGHDPGHGDRYRRPGCGRGGLDGWWHNLASGNWHHQLELQLVAVFGRELHHPLACG